MATRKSSKGIPSSVAYPVTDNRSVNNWVKLVHGVEDAKYKHGSEHPKTLSEMRTLASHYGAWEMYGSALDTYNTILEIQRRTLGVLHADYLSTMASINALVESKNSSTVAASLYEKALKVSDNVFGKDHPTSMSFVKHLAQVYESQGQGSKSKQLAVRMVNWKNKLLSQTKTAVETLDACATNLIEMELYSDAIELLEVLIERRRATLGGMHIQTLETLHRLAKLHASRQHFDSAKRLYDELIDISTELFGANMPFTLSVKHGLAALYEKNGRQSLAEPMYKEVLLQKTAVLGEEHPDTAATIKALGLLHAKRDQKMSYERKLTKACCVCTIS